MKMSVRTSLAVLLTALLTGLLALGGGAASAADVAVDNVSVSNPYYATASPDGRLTARASVTGFGTDGSDHARSVSQDWYAQAGGQIPVEGGATYRVTVTLDDARAIETQPSGEARGYVDVLLYDCCFAGETQFLQSKQAELPNQAGTVTITQDIFIGRDTNLAPNVQLHAKATAYHDRADTVTTEASATVSNIDVTALDAPDEDDPATPPPPKKCFLIFCS